MSLSSASITPRRPLRRLRHTALAPQPQAVPQAVCAPHRWQEPWDTYDSVDVGERHQVKRITVRPGAKLSLQMHHHRAEPWRVTLVDTGDDTMTGGRVKRIAEYVKDDEAFCLTYGDGVSNVNITGRVDCVVTLEEHSVMGGLGACVAEEVAVHRPLPVCRIGIEDRFSAYCGTWDYLLQEHRLDLPSVKQRIESFLAAFPARTAGTHHSL